MSKAISSTAPKGERVSGRYMKALDIHAANPNTLQPGQWVFAGHDDGAKAASRGRFVGVRPNGCIVVAWQGNARAWRKNSEGTQGYYSAMRDYANAGKIIQ